MHLQTYHDVHPSANQVLCDVVILRILGIPVNRNKL